MNFYFDYIYYRLTQFYFRWDGREGIAAIIGISMIQCLLIGDIVFFLVKFFFDRNQTSPYSSAMATGGAIVCLILIVYNYFKYRKKFNQLKTHWKNESPGKRRLKGVYVVFSLIIPWVPIILMGIYW